MGELKYEEAIIHKVDEEEETEKEVAGCQFPLASKNSSDIHSVRHHGEQHEDPEEDNPDHAGQLNMAKMAG